MFKRFSVAEDVSTQQALKSSVQRSIKRTICDQFPAIEEYIDDIIPKKGDVFEAKCKDRSTFIVVEGEPLFFHPRDGAYFPTLRLLHKYPIMMPKIQVDKGAIKFILSDADIMAPGITSKGGAIITELPEGAPVAIYAEGKEHALAVGTMIMSTADVRSKGKGPAITNLHHLGDSLWKTESFA